MLNPARSLPTPTSVPAAAAPAIGASFEAISRFVHATRLTTPRKRRHPQAATRAARAPPNEASLDRETELERLPGAMVGAGFAGRGKPSVLALIGAA